MSGWGIYVKTRNGPEQRYYAKESIDYYPPTEKTFTCEVTIDESEITIEGNEKVAEVTIIPFYSLWNDIATSFMDSNKYNISILTIVDMCLDNNHPHMIDLGLPSGTKWACCNVGASSPEEYGGYYNFDLAQAYNPPSREQIIELVENCSYTGITSIQNGVAGGKFTGPNGNTIFLPAAGCYRSSDGVLVSASGYGFYWSSMPNDEDTAFELIIGPSFGSSRAYWDYYYRNGRQSVRPVR